MTPHLSPLYLILDPAAVGDRVLTDAMRLAAAGGARLFQYRDKHSAARTLYRRAAELRRLAADAGALFLVNDRCDLAMAVDADGVHLGQDDLPLADARAIVGAKKLIGLSTHTPQQVHEAAALGADYVAYGPLFPTMSKPDHEPVVGLEGLRRARALTELPLYGIGGITVGNVEDVIATGATGVAVISAVWSAPDLPAAVKTFLARLPQPTRRAGG
jgi:thiamine-phosphate pyrophosphorylase